MKFKVMVAILLTVLSVARCYAEAPKVQRPEPWAKHLSLQRIEVAGDGLHAVLRWRQDHSHSEPFRFIEVPLGGTVAPVGWAPRAVPAARESG